MSSPRVLLIDIETLPNVGYTWGKYEQNVISFVREWELASFAWKELGRGKVQCIARPDYKSEAAFVHAVRKIVDDADVLIGHNIDNFDAPMLHVKFAKLGMRPTVYRTVDTKKIAKRSFRFMSNKLDDLGNVLGVGRKLQTGGFELWEKCIAGDPAAWRKMVRYNKQDVLLLERVYLRLRAWYPTHPNFALYSGEGDKPECPVCESTKVQRRGYRVMTTRRAARFQCQNPKCGHWFSRALSKVEKAAA